MKPRSISRLHHIRRTPDGDTRFVHHVSIDHRCLNILVPQQILHRPDVRTGLKQVSCKAVTQRMRNCILSQANAINHHLEEVSEIVFTHMVPPQFTAARVHRQTLRRKDPLPAKLATLVRILALQRIRQVDLAKPRFEVALVQTPDAFDLLDQLLATALRQNGKPPLREPPEAFATRAFRTSSKTSRTQSPETQ